MKIRRDSLKRPIALVERKDPKVGTGKKPKGSGRRLYTDEDPSDTVSVKFSTAQDIRDTLSKESFKSKSHKRQSQIINLIHQRVRAAYQNAKDPKVKERLKRALDYAEDRKEASKRKTQRMNKAKPKPRLITGMNQTGFMAVVLAMGVLKKRRRKPDQNQVKNHRFVIGSVAKEPKAQRAAGLIAMLPMGKVVIKPVVEVLVKKRKRYPACRPTPAACKEKGRGKSWGKKVRKNENIKRTTKKNYQRRGAKGFVQARIA